MVLSHGNDLFGNAALGANCVLVGSCLGESTGGGLVSFDGKDLEVIDTISSTGLAVADGRFMRLLWCRGDFAAPGELVVSDATGVEKYFRIDSLRDPHDILFDGQNYVIASAGANTILWIAKSGELIKNSKIPGEPDSWHVNSLLLHRAELYVTAFGRFNSYRQWNHHVGEGTGIVFNHRTGKDVLTGLEMPHHARIIDDNWIVCNSGTRELMQFGQKTGKLVRSILLEKWTRGLAFSDKYIFVGESARRYRAGGDVGDALASIAILDKITWQIVHRVPLPFEEVYDLVLVPMPLLEGIRRGFKTNPQRVYEQNQHSLFTSLGIKPVHIWASGDLLPPQACAARISVDVESEVESNIVLERQCVVENCGTGIFVSVKPHPVFIAYRWLCKKTGHYVRHVPIGTRLPLSVPPGESITCKVRLRTPATEGLYELQVSLFQKGQGFFSDLGFSEEFKTRISVVKSPQTVPSLDDLDRQAEFD